MSETFEYYLETEDFHFKYAKGRPAVEGREYHGYNEIVLFMEGSSFLISKNIQQRLTHNSIVIIPQENFHRFCVEEPENYVRCILGFRTLPETESVIRQAMDTVKVINTPERKIISVFENLTDIAESELSYDEKCLFIKGALMQLLVYFKKYPSEMVCGNMTLSPEVIRALELIDKRYAERLTVEDIAKRLFVSQSYLAHKFSKEMNMPIYRYITKKRLSEAHRLICRGESLTGAAQKSGFNDYSNFYRLYKKYYGHTSHG